MNDLAAISGQVVDIQNDSRHKGSIKVTVHVPAEAGPHLTRVLGWPTYTNPVPVGMARLNPDQPAKEKAEIVTASEPVSPARALPQKIGRICADIRFRRWAWDRGYVEFPTEDLVSQWVREQTKVTSRAEILPGTSAEQSWNIIESAYKTENALP